MNLNKELRKYICVNGSPHYVSLDFSGMHINLCYHLKLKAFTSDPYWIEGFQDYPKETSKFRKIFKQLALVSLNADDDTNAIYATIKKLKNKGIRLEYKEVKEFLKILKGHHKDIDKCFNSDFGVKLMYYDAQVIEAAAHFLMINKKITVLSVHDELMCHPDDVNIVQHTMINFYRKVLQSELKKDLKEKGLHSLPEYIRPEIDIK